RITVCNPVARAALLLFGMLAVATLYGQTLISEALGILGKYIDLAFVPLFMLMFSEAKTRQLGERMFFAASTLILLLSGLLATHILAPQSWMSSMATADRPAVFHSYITQGNMMAYAAFLALLKVRDALDVKSRALWASFAAAAIFNVLFMLEGRTGYMILLLLMAWFAWSTLTRYFHQRGKAWGWRQGAGVMVACMLMVSIMYMLSPRLHDRVETVKQELQAWHPDLGNEVSSAGQRLDYYYNTLHIVERNWWSGVGTGGFPDAYEAQIQGTNAIPTRNPHNEYLMIAVQTGVLGLLLLLYLYYTEWRVAPLLESPYAQDAARGLLIAYVVNCSFNSALHDHADGLFFAFMSALWFSTLRSNKP
ncbi:MAG: O-antigen ligase family protein, partial [Gallionella sp.]